MSQFWDNRIMVSWVGAEVDPIWAEVVDEILKEVPEDQMIR